MADFGDVRIHAGPCGAGFAAAHAARAVTLGADIAFNNNQFQPETAQGRRLIAHELAHVIQQRDPGGARSGPEHEAAAEAAARTFQSARGTVRAGPPAAVGVQRQALPETTTGTPAPTPQAQIDDLASVVDLFVAAAPKDRVLNNGRTSASVLRDDAMALQAQINAYPSLRADLQPLLTRVLKLQLSLLPVLNDAEAWHAANPAGESLGMLHEREGTRMAGEGLAAFERAGGSRGLASAANYASGALSFANAGLVAVVDAAESLGSFGFHELATHVSKAYTRGDISWNEGVWMLYSGAAQSLVIALTVKRAGLFAGALGETTATRLGFARLTLGRGLVTGVVSGTTTATAALAAQTITSYGLEQLFRGPAAKRIWASGIPTGKQWAVCIPLAALGGSLAGARAVQIEAAIVGKVIDTPGGPMRVLAVTAEHNLVLEPEAGLRASPPAPPPATEITLVYDEELGAWHAPRPPQALVRVDSATPSGAQTVTTHAQLDTAGTRALPAPEPAGDHLPAGFVDDAISASEAGGFSSDGSLISDLIGHGHARAARAQLGQAGTGLQSAHNSPQAVMRSVPGWDPRAAITRLMNSSKHRGFDDPWKATSREMAKTDNQMTVQRFFEMMRDAIRANPHFSAQEAASMIELLRDEVYVQNGLRDTDMVRIPYSKP